MSNELTSKIEHLYAFPPSNEIMNLPQSSLTVNMCTKTQRKITSPLLVLRLLGVVFFRLKKGAVFDFPPSSVVFVYVTLL